MSQHANTQKPIENGRTFGAIIEDEAIEAKVLARLRRKDPKLTNSINVTSYNRILLLAGKVENETINKEIVQIAASVPHIRQIQNEIRVGATPTQANNWYDFWLTSKLKAKMLFTRDFPSKKIKVSTAQGVLYLMGLVTKEEANQAVWLSRRMNGVRKVVTLFEYVDENDQPSPIQNAME